MLFPNLLQGRMPNLIFFVLKSILCGCIKAYFCPKHIKIKHDYLHVRLIYVHLQYDYRWQTTCLDLSRMLWRLQNQLFFVLNFPKSRNICQMVKYFILKWKPYSNQLHFKIYFSTHQFLMKTSEIQNKQQL